MGIIIRQSIKTSIILYSGVAIGMFSRLFLFTEYLTAEQIGLFDNLIYTATILVGVFNFGLTATIPRYYSHFAQQGKVGDFLGFILRGSLIGMLLTVFMIVFGKELIFQLFARSKDSLSAYYYVLIPLTIFSGIRVYFTNYSLAKHRTTIQAILNDFLFKLTTVFVLMMMAVELWTFDEYIYIYVLVSFISVLGLGVYAYRSLNFSFVWNYAQLSSEDKKKIYTFSSFIFLGSLSAYCFQYVDTIMLGSMKGFSDSGIYSIAFLLGLSIEMPRRVINSMAYPILVSNFDNNNIKGVEEIYKKSSINQGIIGSILLILVWASIDEIFYLIPNSEMYSAGKYVVLLIALSRLIDMLMGVNSEILRASPKYKLDLVLISVLITISIGANYLLIPKFGLNGAALATLFTIIVYNLVRFVSVWMFFRISPFSRKTIVLVVFFVVILGFLFFFKGYPIDSMQEAFLSLLVKTFFWGGLMTYVCYKSRMSEDFNHILKNLFSRVVKPFKKIFF